MALRLPPARNILWLNISVKKMINKNSICSRERAAITTPQCLGWTLGAGSLLAGPDRKRPHLGSVPELLRNQNHCSDHAVILHFVPSRTQCGVLEGMPVRPHRFQSPASSRRISKLLLATSSSTSLPAHLVVISLLISTSSRR